ncbi:opa-interacting protein 2 [Capsaspora owczarzaki ATCC 30864]|uniref:Ribosomal RNA-processing protein 43 n=1 Tax=Capsaspora owczarzaki (strain ATCC 30864) TaxID=595528 RepID=A0A0D2U5U7_CAPO3|nr:opa-interacting protein 2 [Capsaspora owczarzaki ATCC 30864]KJE90501.1 opa-interacting protein 2 [Capsaspora owczarzaki ATCC 30864]|eukprot:XP_004364679.2 opa-interacting protein 2 [Capsaspora owczarzaki ATCC 30864]
MASEAVAAADSVELAQLQRDAETFKRVHPLEYYRRFLSQQLRPDGRGLERFRDTSLSINPLATAHASALAKIGQTSVLCGIKAELAVPSLQTPGWGFVVTNVTFPPMCSASSRLGPPSEQAQALSRLMHGLVVGKQAASSTATAPSVPAPTTPLKSQSAQAGMAESNPADAGARGIVDLNELCITRGELCWCLYVDAVCLDDAGNSTDAALLAIVGALHALVLPAVTLDAASGKPGFNPSGNSTQLTLPATPFAATFSLFDGNAFTLADPTAEEEAMQSGAVTIVADVSSENPTLWTVHKPGGTPLSATALRQCISQAVERIKTLDALLQAELASQSTAME